MNYMRRVLRFWWLPSVLLSLSGCGSDGSAYQADPAQAEKTLRAFLDAWKAGLKPESLENQSPPIRVKDLDWQDGLTLVSYQAESQPKLVGYDVNYPVVLQLKNRKGGNIKKSAVYTVSTHPEILIMRQEG